jgi:L-lysine 2,3-aminomutase
MYTHFYFVDIFPTEHVLFVKRVKTDWLQLPLAAFHINHRKEMKALRRLAENDIITRGVTVKIQQVAVCGN